MGVQTLAELGIHGGGRSQDDVRVPRQVLGDRVHDEVGTPGQRTLQQGRGEGAVHAAEHTQATGARQDLREVGDLEHGIGGRLQQHQICALGGGQHGVGVGHLHGIDADPTLLLGLAHERHGAHVDVHRHDDPTAQRHEREHGRDRGHPGGEGQRRQRRALELTQHGFEVVPGRVAGAAVHALARHGLPRAAVGRAQHDRRADGSIALRGRATAGDRDRGRTQPPVEGLPRGLLLGVRAGRGGIRRSHGLTL